MKPGAAIMKLTAMGFRFKMNGDKIRYDWCGKGKPDMEAVAPLFEAIKAERDAAILFLRVYCPRCGGCVFYSDHTGEQHCAKCEPPDWNCIEKLFPYTAGVCH
ncbi:30S ribosomal protein S27ae [Desulfobacca acetoxidans]|uniref:Small ribosomal subunit protein eS31 domain-containing protein n=1 Tax=Desulfobacca acetoxidans (strain ATCC 700848 / DSM 11109 / ASRB2) TaxID=880072 RepID=F2NG08_DESAR|nr:hypothetical protein [Desulfobacca acetoxidans]AEB08421.1 hypothetical protein Desac_0535 [Desulfobacca acetoxidans DSM 11109]